ncbi:DUF3592 domain-containing protein [Kribbella monticola]|uniref:DUF3592 domain-containing protein n=1 Tax=Kribbella monticola TaxID=2185285 RepID=UPI000DD4E350|nr:DUF3592 domain-containing protein [Kribbella monticola]
MSDDNDDLEGWQLVLLLVFFCTVGGGLYLIGWLTRPSFFWDHPLACAATAGVACYPARFLVERFSWWNRLEERHASRHRRREATPSSAPRRARSMLLRALRVLTGVSIALGSLAVLPIAVLSSHDYENMIEHGPIQQAVVVSVERDRWSKSDEVTVKVARPSDAKPVELDGGYDLTPTPQVGDHVAVVVDPDDPSLIISATKDWSTPWWAYPLILACLAIPFAVGLAIAFA